MAKYEDPRQFRIFGGETLANLEMQVNEYVKIGYRPCGGIFSLDGRCVFQPMFRLADKDEREMTEGSG